MSVYPISDLYCPWCGERGAVTPWERPGMLVSPCCSGRGFFVEDSMWVSVEERLPGEGLRQLATANGEVDVAAWWGTNGGEWRYDSDGDTMHGVTYWMPLPGAPG